MPTFKDRAVVGGYTAGWTVVRKLPAPVVRRTFDSAADLAFFRGGPGVDRLRVNLGRVLGPHASKAQLHGTTRAALRSYARYWAEVFRLPDMDRTDVVRRTDIVGLTNLDDALAAGPVILALPHAGNWDVAAVWFLEHGVPFTTVAERLEPAEIFEKFLAFREGLGMEVIPLSGGERPPLDVLTERLQAGRSLCLLADRDLSRHGVPVTFFDERATMPPGPGLLTVRTGAALIPTTLSFTPGGWQITFHAPCVDPGAARTDEDRVASLTQQMAWAFERAIRAHPADWHMLQRLWTSDLTPRA